MEPYIQKVQYYETDQMGVVHHSNFIRWMESARIDALDKAGLTYKKMEEEGFFGATLAVSCEYRRSVRFGQTVEIECKLKEMDERFMTISYTIRDANSKKERAFGESKHCFLGFDGKMISLETEKPELFESIKALLSE